MRTWIAVVWLALAACSHELDALYEDDGPADSGSAEPALPEGVPRLPALPDRDREDDCAACAERTDACVTARHECLLDDDCTDELRCKGECRDPACLQTCSAEHGWSPWYTEYASCVLGQCASDCNVGDNFECQGDYDWPAAEAKSFEVAFRFTQQPTYYLGREIGSTWATGDTIAACPDVEDCAGAETDTGRLGIDGWVRLRLEAKTFQPMDFRGYLEGQTAGVLVYPAPLSRPQEHFVGTVPTRAGPPGVDLERARMRVAVADCLAMPVAGARVSVVGHSAVRAFALDINFLDGGSSALYREEPTAAAGVAVLFDVPDSAADEVVRVRAERRTGELIAERAVFVRPGNGTSLTLLPSARSE